MFYKTLLIVFLMLFSNSTLAENVDIIQQCQPRSDADIVGLAVDKKLQQAIYCEYYFNLFDGERLIGANVEYWDLASKKIATKAIDYSFNTYRPNVLQQDFRHKEVRSIMLSDDGQSLALMYTKPLSGGIKKFDLAVNTEEALPNAEKTSLVSVADAGLDRMIQDEWDRLAAGDTVMVKFISPVHGRTIRLTIKQHDKDVCVDQPYSAAQTSCFIVTPKSGFLRLLSKPIALLYKKADRRLSLFSGISNITDIDGKDISVNIYYHYKD